MRLMNEIRKRKEGIVVGALAGLVATFIAEYIGVDLNMLVQTQSVIEPVFEVAGEAQRVAMTKLGTILVTGGAFIGAVLDKHVDKLIRMVRGK